jgi:DNA polymerase III delta prime subunit
MCEANADCRFILTCNYENKIIPAIKSRCPVIHLSYTAQDLLKRLVNILTQENIKFTKPDLANFVNNVLKTYYPDIRAIITQLQNACVSGKLQIVKDETQEKELDSFISELYNKIHDKNSLRDIMSYIDKNKTVFSNDYNMLACKMLEYDTDLYTVKRVEKLVECIYRLNIVADPSVQFCGFICIMLNDDYNK